MIALLTGTIAHKSPEYIILDVHGVGYRVQIPFSTYYDLPPEGGSLSLNIYTHVKEDAINLYGFRTPAEKQFFQLLISVSGIGPKLAKDILSNVQVNELGDALLRGDLARLCAIPGIGRKTAERVVLELREKVKKLDFLPPAQASERSAVGTDIMEDVTSALINLGYKEAVVNKVLAELSITPDTGMETILKQALKQLMR
ncbi:Holliday junction branch migration protein RuvA [Geomobilimonas luticola]|uniref:Holliday junction branch migration complex subunit RuvA n=1 Tax=Geomobilimonas luticola TaxID=1114878 RepID=A0ABS5SHC5_9BACT|nr:Holliday junction branch migration protein RuvA [Geomobilimonas luticola]MBT0654769.1 Holliday junction branch migration protein RuvA [Geomobilimonas luticola]